MNLDRKVWGFESFFAAEKSEAIELKQMSYQTKSSTITFLRECCHGKKAATGRLNKALGIDFEKRYKRKKS